MAPLLEVMQAGREHQTVLENLLELYIHDFSEMVPVDVDENGRFGYRRLPLYWSEPGHLPFLAKLEGRPAGFALVTRQQGSSAEVKAWDMAEFFVLRRYRHRGVGTGLAEEVWKQCPGNWQIRVRVENLPALGFWKSAIEKFTAHAAASQELAAEGTMWRLFSFSSPGRTV